MTAKRIFVRFLKTTAWALGVLLLLLSLFCWYVVRVSDVSDPVVRGDTSAVRLTVAQPEGTLRTIGTNWMRRNRWGLYELSVGGAPFERGVVNGKLSAQQIVDQEVAFTDQIRKMIPSPAYLKFIRYIVGFLNRNLPQAVPEEYREEIYGVSRSASDSFNWIGSKYARLLNYHAAHDIGHALQNLMLVGCTSFGAWGDKTDRGEMLLGRNFDFWVGDRFAENKIVAFYAPDRGHKFAFVTWGGFTGVVSGMNDAGLTVTINAAKSEVPGDAATPVSLVAREILQYGGDLGEALAIAHRRKMFVSESFMIGSARDRKAIVVEKTPDTLAVYDPAADNILCTNHYQSKFFGDQQLNRQQKDRSASVYRERRLEELMRAAYPLNPAKMAAILRDRRGLGGADIGEGNEKAVNQLIAHHSIIFSPDSLRMWVSAGPWQLGTYVCYDLRKIFAMKGLRHDVEVADTALNIAPDPFLQSAAYRRFLTFRQNKLALLDKAPVDTFAVTHSNPNLYDAWRVAGDYCVQRGWYGAAVRYYGEALKREIATVDEREGIAKKLERARKKAR